MRFLFVHQNFPAQFVHMAKHLAAAGHEVLFACEHQNRTLPGVKTIRYEEPKAGHPDSHHYIRGFERQIRAGQQLARILIKLKQAGARPDIIIGHAGWGELLFAKDIFPDVPERVSLTLSGHTHGGQVNIFGWKPIVPSRYGARYAGGHVEEGGRQIVVSRGLGCSGIPVRFMSRPEIVLLELG